MCRREPTKSQGPGLEVAHAILLMLIGQKLIGHPASRAVEVGLGSAVSVWAATSCFNSLAVEERKSSSGGPRQSPVLEVSTSSLLPALELVRVCFYCLQS